jgi:voltage-gated potassium channel
MATAVIEEWLGVDPGAEPLSRRWRAVRLGYELLLLAAAVFSAFLLRFDTVAARRLSWVIWAWFVADYVVRLLTAQDRRAYVRGHRFELLAILPVDLFRPMRLLRLLRPIALIVRATKGLRDVLGLTGFGLIGAVGVTVVGVGGALFAHVEPESAPSLGDGLWWSLTTASTVGYGDISPNTTSGRIIASVLMVTGIGLLGAFTGQVAERLTRPRQVAPSSGDPDVDHVINRLRQWHTLSAADRRKVAGVLHSLVETTDAGPDQPSDAQAAP